MQIRPKPGPTDGAARSPLQVASGLFASGLRVAFGEPHQSGRLSDRGRVTRWAGRRSRRHAEEAPSDSGFTFSDGPDTAIGPTRSADGAKDFHTMGRAEIIRQELRVGHVEERSTSMGVVVLCSGRRPFDGFSGSVDPALIRSLHIATREIDAGSDRAPCGRTRRGGISGGRAFVREELWRGTFVRASGGTPRRRRR